MAGYNLVFDRFLLPIEARANFFTKSSITSNPNTVVQSGDTSVITQQMNQSNSFNLLLKPGVLINDTNHIYLVGGITSSSISVSSNYVTSTPLDIRLQTHAKKQKTGSIFGIGMQQKMKEKFSVRLEFDHTDYGAIGGGADSIEFFDPGLGTNGILRLNANNKMKENAVILGLIYEFA